jgi:hypothetical protein
VRQDVVRPAGPTVHVPRWTYLAVTFLSLLLGAEAVVRGTRAVVTVADSDLTNFFLPSADYILRGDPWHMYAVRASGLYPNYNPPLSMILYAPLLALARTVGFAANAGQEITFVALPFVLVAPLLGVLVVSALRRLYPQIPDTQQLLAYMLVVLSPLTWQSIGTWYHLEQPLMLCLVIGAVIALQAHREGLAGLLAGLALLTRTTALFPLLALGILLLVERRWRAAALYGAITAVVAAIGLAPFFLFDRADAVYSFLTWRGSAAIGGNSIWSIFASSSTSGLRYTLNAIAERLDMPSVLLFVVGVSLLAGRRLRISAYSRDAWAVMAIAALAVPMLSKTNWPYYYLEPFIPLLVWEFASMHDRLAGVWRWPVLASGFLVVTATLSQYLGLKSVGALDRVVLGLVEFGTMLAFAVAIWIRMRAAKPGALPAAAASGDPRMGVGTLGPGAGRASISGAAQPAWQGGGQRPTPGAAAAPQPTPHSSEWLPPAGPASRAFPGTYPPSVPLDPGGSPGRMPPPAEGWPPTAGNGGRGHS